MSSRFYTKLLQREVLLSMLLIGFTGAGLGMSTSAYLTDSDFSQQNTIQSGTMDLSLEGSDTLSKTFSTTNGQPGTAIGQNLTIQNSGSITADHIEVSFTFSENDSRTEPSDNTLNAELNTTETASLINVTQLEYQNSAGNTLFDALASGNMEDKNGNGIVDLEDVQIQQNQLDDLIPPQENNGNSTFLVTHMEIANDDSGAFIKGGNTNGNLTGYDEDIMADGINVKITVTLNQDSSQ